MTDYMAVRIDVRDCNADITDLLAAYLADAGYESFVPDDQGVTAYIRADAYSPKAVESVIAGFPMEIEARFSDEFVKGEDWNSEWEKHYFQPIVIGGEVAVHSSFHTDVPAARYDITIDPKMAFGTGHHATTTLMLEYLLELPMEGRTVIDMGTGTGILAMLCAMRGAARVTGIEIDPGAWENAVDNLKTNRVDAIVTALCGDAALLSGVEPADYFLANINRNIILGDMAAYAAALKSGGEMALSGFYEPDADIIAEAAAPLGLHEVRRRVKDKWCALLLKKD